MSTPSSDAGETAPASAPPPKATKPKATKAVKQAENPAEALLIAKERERAESATAALARLNTENLFFLRCVNRPDHHGIYLLEYPTDGNIHPGLWCSIEHAPGEPWFKPAIRCQECMVDGDPNGSMWLKPHQMPNGQITFTLAHPYGVEKDKTEKPGAGHINRINRAEVERRMGKSIEEMLRPVAVVAGQEGA